MDDSTHPNASGTEGPEPVSLWHPIDVILLAVAGASLAAACVLTSRKKYFWCDEVFSWTLVTDRSFRHMLFALVQGADGAPPVFYVVARLWSHAFGTSEMALRSLSCLGFIVALAVMWAVVRRAYGTWPAAIASVTVFATSQSVVYQIAEARFYGLLTALVACAVYLYTRAVRIRTFTRRLFALTALTHAALLYTHLFGSIYSAAILAAWVLCDRVRRRPWHTGYLSVVLGWLVFAPWLPSLRRIAELGKPHSWIPVPSLSDLIVAYGFSLRYFPLVVAAIVVLALVGTGAAPGDGGSRPDLVPRWRASGAPVLAGIVVLVVALWYVPPNPFTPGAMLDAWTASNGLSVVALVIIVVVQSAASRRRAAKTFVPPPAVAMDESLLIVGCALLAVPGAAYVVSHLEPSIFHERYLIPASLGLIPILGHFAWWSTNAATRSRVNRDFATVLHGAVGAAWAVLIVLIAIRPVLATRHLPGQDRPGSDIEAVVPPGMTVVVESALDFMPLQHYRQRSDLAYTYPMDWPAAVDPHSWLGATVEYKILEIWRRVGLLSAAASDGSQVPCTGRPFVVLHTTINSWYADRIAGDSAFDVQTLGPSQSTLVKGTILLIKPRAAIAPAMCRSSAPNQPSRPPPRA